MRTAFDPAAARRNALRFSRQQFMTSFRQALDEAIAGKTSGVDTAGMPGADARNSSNDTKETRVVDSDAARVPPPRVQADRESKQ
jgi:hypothetical protein